MPDYSLTKVYRVFSESAGLTYIGSTYERLLSQRISKHIYDFKRWKEGKYNHVTVFEILKYDDAKIILLQSYPECKSSDEKCKYEQEWIDRIDCVNKNKAYTGLNKKEYDAQYRSDHREEIKEYIKQYKAQHREEISKQRSEKVHCDVCDCDILRINMARHNQSKKHIKHSKESVESS
jgi:hypothetical protein